MTTRRAFLAAALSAPGASQHLRRVLIVTGDSDTRYHDWRILVPHLKSLLDNTGRFQVAQTEQPASLTRAGLERYSALVVFYNGQRWGAAAETAVEGFVGGGGGLVTLHGVTYGPLMGTIQGSDGKFRLEPAAAWPAWPRMLGVQWAPESIGHARRHEFTVRVVDRAHPITAGLDASFTMDDELYHRMSLLPEARVLATAFSNPALGGTGGDEPVMWTVAYGRGRSFHSPLGHDVKAMSAPGFVHMFTRAVEWAAAAAGAAARKDVRSLRFKLTKQIPGAGNYRGSMRAADGVRTANPDLRL